MPDPTPQPTPMPTPTIYRFSKATGAQRWVAITSTPQGDVPRILPNLSCALEYQAIMRHHAPDKAVRLVSVSEITIEDLIELWIRSRRDLTDDSRRRYRRLLRQVAISIGATKLKNLGGLVERDWQEATCGARQIRILTRAALDHGVREGLLDRNPLR